MLGSGRVTGNSEVIGQARFLGDASGIDRVAGERSLLLNYQDDPCKPPIYARRTKSEHDGFGMARPPHRYKVELLEKS
jgi:hypothetical protein